MITATMNRETIPGTNITTFTIPRGKRLREISDPKRWANKRYFDLGGNEWKKDFKGEWYKLGTENLLSFEHHETSFHCDKNRNEYVRIDGQFQLLAASRAKKKNHQFPCRLFEDNEVEVRDAQNRIYKLNPSTGVLIKDQEANDFEQEVEEAFAKQQAI